ncbi:MAG: SLOG family protein [Anaerotignaceae bacterium]
MNTSACCFTGHRHLPVKNIQRILMNLDREIEKCIAEGVTTFVCGGALGFDQIAASLVITKKEMGKKIRLVFALPCKNQEKLWNTKEKTLYRTLLKEADDIIYVSENYDLSCMSKRNCYMVEYSAYCICALLNEKSGTGQTVRYAQERGLTVINIAE